MRAHRHRRELRQTPPPSRPFRSSSHRFRPCHLRSMSTARRSSRRALLLAHPRGAPVGQAARLLLARRDHRERVFARVRDDRAFAAAVALRTRSAVAICRACVLASRPAARVRNTALRARRRARACTITSRILRENIAAARSCAAARRLIGIRARSAVSAVAAPFAGGRPRAIDARRNGSPPHRGAHADRARQGACFALATAWRVTTHSIDAEAALTLAAGCTSATVRLLLDAGSADAVVISLTLSG
jgi:hypothetical protein